MIENDKTESKIFAQIKQSLDSYEEEYIPGSWETFLQKRKKKNRGIFLRIASGIAACLLLGFLGFNYIHSGKMETINLTANKCAKPVNEAPLLEKHPKNISKPSTAMIQTAINQANDIRIQSKTTAVQAKNLIAARKETQSATTVVSNSAIDPADKNTTSSEKVDHQPEKSDHDTSKSRTETQKGQEATSFPTPASGREEKSLASLSRRKIRFGINFSPGVNSTQSSSSMNFMGGVSADIPLSSKIQLSTGLQIENQSIVKNIAGIVSSSSSPQNQMKTKLINLDLPVNLTWKFASEKSQAYYVSAGLSSLVYLRQQNENTTYSQDLTPLSSVVNGVEVMSYSIVNQVSVIQNTVTPNQTFDFAGRINFMVGFEKKLSEKLFIHFEPYTKFSTSSRSSGYLNHTTSGINFKISF